jgi:hypothetical protein
MGRDRLWANIALMLAAPVGASSCEAERSLSFTFFYRNLPQSGQCRPDLPEPRATKARFCWRISVTAPRPGNRDYRDSESIQK